MFNTDTFMQILQLLIFCYVDNQINSITFVSQCIFESKKKQFDGLVGNLSKVFNDILHSEENIFMKTSFYDRV